MHTSHSTDPCENATKHSCLCGDCLGALHRWRGLITLIRDPRARSVWIGKHEARWLHRRLMDERQSARVEDFDKRLAAAGPWATAKMHRSRESAWRLRERSRGSVVNRESASDYVLAGLIASLAGHPSAPSIAVAETILEEVWSTAEKIKSGANARAGQNLSTVARSRVWCTLLAQLAESASNASTTLDCASIAASYFASPSGQTSDARTRYFVETALIPAIDDAIKAGDRTDVAEALQLATLFICPEPEDHSTVLHGCFLPLVMARSLPSNYDLPLAVLRR